MSYNYNEYYRTIGPSRLEDIYDYKYQEWYDSLNEDEKRKAFLTLQNDLANLVYYSERSACKFDYVIRRSKSGLSSLMQCSTCGLRYQSMKGHKIADCNEEQFKKSINDYKEKLDKDLKKQCISDRILLYLRYGFDTFDFKNKDSKIDEKQKYEEICMDLYKRIRGNELYLGKNPRGLAAAIFYIAYIFIGISHMGGDELAYFKNPWTARGGSLITQEAIHKTFNISGGTIYQLYKFIRKTENI